MTCKDNCLHYDVCWHIKKTNGVDFLRCGFSCIKFKDKSKYIELPCKIGDYAYRVAFSDCDTDLTYEIKPLLMSNVLDIVKAMKEQHDWETMTRPQIGWLFFDKSEAEAQLKELNKNA